MLNIAIVRNPGSFLPEVDAYKEYLSKIHGVCVLIYKNIEEIDFCDVAIVFYGFYPKWKKFSFPIIGEYNSLSIGRLRFVRDLIKRIVNKHEYIVCLNEHVRRKLYLSDSVIYRGMGFSPQLIRKKRDVKYDFVYSGTIERPGVKDWIERISNAGYTIAVLGSDSIVGKNIFSLGKLNIEDVFLVYSQCEYGFNFTPNVAPYNQQDSTKVIEYCAAGLKVVSNDYHWVRKFEADNNGRFFYLHEITDLDQLRGYDFIIPNVQMYTWDNVIQSSGLYELILDATFKSNQV